MHSCLFLSIPILEGRGYPKGVPGFAVRQEAGHEQSILCGFGHCQEYFQGFLGGFGRRVFQDITPAPDAAAAFFDLAEGLRFDPRKGVVDFGRVRLLINAA
jgi:hypothetical protein